MHGPDYPLLLFHYKNKKHYMWGFIGHKYYYGTKYLLFQPLKEFTTVSSDGPAAECIDTDCIDVLVMSTNPKHYPDCPDKYYNRRHSVKQLNSVEFYYFITKRMPKDTEIERGHWKLAQLRKFADTYGYYPMDYPTQKKEK